MRKQLGSLIILAFLLIPGMVFAWELDDLSHPIFSEKNWFLEKNGEDYVFDSDGTKVVYSVYRIYRSPEHKEYYFQENTVFGERVVRIYILEDNKKAYKSAFRLEKDGTWHGGGVVLWPELMRDSSGKIIGARLIMVKAVNGKFETVMTREVKRK